MTLPALAVTGSTGYLGGLVARKLVERGLALRLLARTPERAPQLPESVAVQATYVNNDDTRQALAGVETLFMVSAGEAEDRVAQHHAFIDAAAAAGVQHIVYTSFVGASPDATFTLSRDHWATEQHIISSGMNYTFLRDNFYLDFLSMLADEHGVIHGPAGDGRVAAVSRADIARCAAVVLAHPAAHENVVYDLTGPEALSLADVASILSARGTPVSFYNETLEEAYEYRRQWPAPQWQYDAWVSTYTAIAAGELSQVTDAVRTLTGTAPESLQQYLARSAATA